MLEESIRVPLIFHAPRRLFCKQNRIEMVDHTDLFSTLLDAAGVREDDERRLARNSPGRSFLPLLTNGPLRGTWKSVQFGEYGPVRMARTDRYKACLYPEGYPNLLFDLLADPAETRNAYDDPSCAGIRESLTILIRDHFSRYREEANDGSRPERLPAYNQLPAWNP
jgi:arylsulfatase A-like enzyme